MHSIATKDSEAQGVPVVLDLSGRIDPEAVRVVGLTTVLVALGVSVPVVVTPTVTMSRDGVHRLAVYAQPHRRLLPVLAYAVTRLKHQAIDACCLDLVRRGEAGKAGPDDDDIN